MIETWRDGDVQGIGPRDWWEKRRGRWTGILCSRRVPASLILAAQDWANAACRDADNTETIFVSGWHSPVEQEIERILARANANLTLTLARSPQNYRLPQIWKTRINARRGLIVSPFETGNRLTARSALARTRWIIENCPRIIVPHATPGGTLHTLLSEALQSPTAPRITLFDHTLHASLFERGAHKIDNKS